MGTHRSSIFSLWLLFIFIAFFLYHFQPSIDSSQSQNLTLAPSKPISNSTESVKIQSQIARHNYIVRFLQYKRAEDHRTFLQSNIRSEGWEWVERRNPAAKYPTDFGLVSIENSVKEVLAEEIRKLGLVKDVNVDMSYRRGLLKDGRDRVGSFADGKKRPGKIFTAMSFSEGQGGHSSKISNTSAKWGRQLLMQVESFVFLVSFRGWGIRESDKSRTLIWYFFQERCQDLFSTVA